MPVLKIKKTDGSWQEVWGCVDGGTSSGAASPKLTNITMYADKWEGSSSPYSQVVSCNGVQVNSKVDLQPTPMQLEELRSAEIALMATNDNGVVTIYSFYDKLPSTMEMQVLITSVEVIV